jgi:hypothetical protein
MNVRVSKLSLVVCTEWWLQVLTWGLFCPFSSYAVIIKNANVVEVPKSLGITIGLKLLLGEYPSLLQRAPHLKEISTDWSLHCLFSERRNKC